MKRSLALIALLQMLLIAGCGGGGSTAANSSGTVTQTAVQTAATPTVSGPSSSLTLEGTANFSGLPTNTIAGGTLSPPTLLQGTPPTGATFTPIGTLSGGKGSEVYGISGDGGTLTGTSLGPTYKTPFKWTAGGGMVALPAFQQIPAGEGHASSEDGIIVGGLVGGGLLSYASVWNPAGVARVQGTIDGTFMPAVVSSLSRDGRIATGSAGSGQYQAFIWTGNQSPTGLGFLGGSPTRRSSEGHGISADGSVVTGISTATEFTVSAYRWTSNAMVALPALPQWSGSNGWAVSADGGTIVGWSLTSNVILGPTFPSQATAWTSAGAVNLGQLAGFTATSQAFGVSSDGAIIVGVAGKSQASLDQAAFIWDATHGMRNLQQVLGSAVPSGWTLLMASCISDDGKTVGGYGADPSGNIVGFCVTLP